MRRGLLGPCVAEARYRAMAGILPKHLCSQKCNLRVVRKMPFCYPAHHPDKSRQAMVRCHLSTLMGRGKLRISEVSRLTGLNRSTVSALYKETATRLDLAAIDALCKLFSCQVGDLFEYLPDENGGQS